MLSWVKTPNKLTDSSLNERLAARGFRSTSHREHVYRVLSQERDHPTAEQVFMRAKKGMADISMATVYNCLDALVKSGLVREVNVDPSAMRYCPYMRDHCHFCCAAGGGGVHGIDRRHLARGQRLLVAERGAVLEQVELEGCDQVALRRKSLPQRDHLEGGIPRDEEAGEREEAGEERRAPELRPESPEPAGARRAALLPPRFQNV